MFNKLARWPLSLTLSMPPPYFLLYSSSLHQHWMHAVHNNAHDQWKSVFALSRYGAASNRREPREKEIPTIGKQIYDITLYWIKEFQIIKQSFALQKSGALPSTRLDFVLLLWNTVSYVIYRYYLLLRCPTNHASSSRLTAQCAPAKGSPRVNQLIQSADGRHNTRVSRTNNLNH